MFLSQSVKLRHWYWLALGLAVALFVVWFSFKVKQPEYQQSATLLSRVDASTGITITGSAGSDALDALQNYNAEKGNGNLLDNQMIIQSRRLLSRVVDSLDLRTAYRIRRGLQPQTLWEHRPFTVKIRDGLDLPLTFDAELTKNGKVEIYNFEIDGKPEDVQPLVDMDKPFFTPYGEITIAHADYDQNFVGQRIHVERMTREQAVMHFFRHTTAKIQDDKADLLQVTVTDDNPYRAAAIRDVLIHVFRADVLEYKNIQANQMSRFVNERLDTLGAKLRFIQLAMAEFRKNNQVMAYEENMRHYLSQSTAAEQQRHELLHQRLQHTDDRVSAALYARSRRFVHTPDHGERPQLTAQDHRDVSEQSGGLASDPDSFGQARIRTPAPTHGGETRRHRTLRGPATSAARIGRPVHVSAQCA